MTLFAVYCSGGIQKGQEKKICWTDNERQLVAAAAVPHRLVFLNPDDAVENLGDSQSLYGRDMYQIQIADFVIVDARERRGIGVGSEMVTAKYFARPLITVAPPNSHYRKQQLEYRGGIVDDYVHPHLLHLSDVVVDDFTQAGAWISNYSDRPSKTTDAISEAIAVYKRNLLERDEPMQRILAELAESGRSSF